MKTLSASEMENVNGGVFWIVVAIIAAAGAIVAANDGGYKHYGQGRGNSYKGDAERAGKSLNGTNCGYVC